MMAAARPLPACCRSWIAEQTHRHVVARRTGATGPSAPPADRPPPKPEEPAIAQPEQGAHADAADFSRTDV